MFLCSNFATDADCVRLQHVPIDPNSKDLYVKCGDGTLLWSVISSLMLVFRTSSSEMCHCDFCLAIYVNYLR